MRFYAAESTEINAGEEYHAGRSCADLFCAWSSLFEMASGKEVKRTQVGRPT
jgi:hypothetical protein